MTRIIWDALGTRVYQTGVDRGMLYLDFENPGVPWSGLISVEEAPEGGQSQPYYFDGMKFLNLGLGEDFTATIKAYTYPEEFNPCDGILALADGLFVTEQPRVPFHLAYRTVVGNDILGTGAGHKIHLVYNALVEPTNRANTSISSSADPIDFSWKITTTPVSYTGGDYKPAAHYIIDSRLTSPETYAALEDLLYGTDEDDCRMPENWEVLELFGL